MPKSATQNTANKIQLLRRPDPQTAGDTQRTHIEDGEELCQVTSQPWAEVVSGVSKGARIALTTLADIVERSLKNKLSKPLPAE